MEEGDFNKNESSLTIKDDTTIKIVFTNKNNEKQIKAENINVKKHDIIDATFMDIKKLNKFLDIQIQNSKKNDILFSLHLKATMMKISDPVIFAETIKVFFKEDIKKHQKVLSENNINFNNGISDLLNKLDKSTQEYVLNDFYNTAKNSLAMVNSEKFITNLHTPSDIIIDASIPYYMTLGAKMFNSDGELKDTKFTIPDSSYAPLFDEFLKDCIKNDKLDVTTMGSVTTIGLMANKAEEYGSHNNTFIAKEDGVFDIIDSSNNILLSKEVCTGDIYRMCITRDVAIQDWLELAYNEVEKENIPGIIWLDEDRAHHIEIKKKIKENILNNKNIKILSTKEATKETIKQLRESKNTICIVGNILRDYLTDLFPIMEVGTSAKMLSIVPLLNKGRIFETGSGGTAPKLLNKFFSDNFLAWDSLGELLACNESIGHITKQSSSIKMKAFEESFQKAIGATLTNKQYVQEKIGGIDNKLNHFYFSKNLAYYLSIQNNDKYLSDKFKNIYEDIINNEDIIVKDYLNSQGLNIRKKIGLNSYYFFDEEQLQPYIRPSKIFNNIINNI
jgi:isocitrate dehydrogenase